jgi:hypothetical protein
MDAAEARLMIERALGVPDLVAEENRAGVAAGRLRLLAGTGLNAEYTVLGHDEDQHQLIAQRVISDATLALADGELDGAITAGFEVDRQLAIRSLIQRSSSHSISGTGLPEPHATLAGACIDAIAAWATPVRAEPTEQSQRYVLGVHASHAPMLQAMLEDEGVTVQTSDTEKRGSGHDFTVAAFGAGVGDMLRLVAWGTNRAVRAAIRRFQERNPEVEVEWREPEGYR